MPDPNVQWTGVLQWHQFANAGTVSTRRTLSVPGTPVLGRVVTLFVLMSTTSFGVGGVTGTTVTDANGVALPFAQSRQTNGNSEGRLVAVPDWPAALGGSVNMDVLITNGAQAGVMLGALLASSGVFAVDYNVSISAAGTSQTASLSVPLPSFPQLLAAGASSLNTSTSGGPALAAPIGLDPDWPVAVSSSFNEPRSVFGTFYAAGALSTYTGAQRSATVTPSWDVGVIAPWATTSFTTRLRPGQGGRAFGAVLG